MYPLGHMVSLTSSTITRAAGGCAAFAADMERRRNMRTGLLALSIAQK
jgi:hypothetical protein